ncbi:hypothetical protein [Pseudomonas sp. HLT2-19-2]
MKTSKNNKNIFFLAVNTGFTDHNQPNDAFLEFYESRSGNGLYCSIIGNVAIPNGHGSNNSTPIIENNPIWRKIAKSILNKQTLPGIQFSTTWPNYIGELTFIAKNQKDQLDNYKKISSSFDSNYITTQFQLLESATKIAIDSGFQHIQLHVAHGYFFNLILDHRFSKYADLGLELASNWLLQNKKNGIETSIRASMSTGADEMDSTDSFSDNPILTLPTDYFDLSAGFYNINKRLIYPSTKTILETRYKDSLNIAKQNSNIKFIISGKSQALFSSDLPDNAHIGICRDLIANENFLSERIHGCQNKMKCHYFSRGKNKLTCGMWKK